MAKGYQSFSDTIDVNNRSFYDIILDYRCDYQIIVYGIEKNVKSMSDLPPQENARVLLYRSILCPRPVNKSLQVLVETKFGRKPSLYNIQLSGNQFHIIDSGNLSRFDEIIEKQTSKHLESGKYNLPSTGDFVDQIGTCSNSQGTQFEKSFSPLFWYFIPIKNTETQLVRMVDTLQISLHDYEQSDNFSRIRFSRLDGGKSEKKLYLPCFNISNEIVSEEITDENGIAYFKDLKPGLYFVQAKYDEQYSQVRPLTPSTGGTKLRLSSSSTLTVKTIKGGNLSNYFVENTKISLKSINNNSPATILDNTDERGQVRIKSVPFGTYLIKAEPPSYTEMLPVENTVTINQPLQTISLFFNDWSRHSIKGRVIYHGTDDPINGIPLELFEERDKSFYPCSKTISDNNGEFIFQDIPKGIYEIRYIPNLSEKQSYYLLKETPSFPPDHEPFYIPLHDDTAIQLQIVDETVRTVQIEMIGTKETRFSGMITDTRKQPVADAEIHLYRYYNSNNNTRELEIYTDCYDSLRSNEYGEFYFTIYSRDIPSMNGITYSGKITAEVKSIHPDAEPVQFDTGLSSNTSIIDVFERITPQMKGAADFQFRLGENISSINVMLDDSHLFTVYGRLRTESDAVPYDAKIGILQNNINRILLGTYYQNGEFSIPGVEIGNFVIIVDDAYEYNDNERINYENIRYSVNKSQAENISNYYHKHDENLKIEITLKESGYLMGRLLDLNNNPLSNIVIQTDPDLGKSKYSYTDNNGRFKISNLSKTETYSLYANVRGNNVDKKIILLMSDLQPNLDNIILQVKR